MNNLIIGLVLVLVCVEANEEFYCKARPGCHIAKCDPGWPMQLNIRHMLERNEYPISCVKTSQDAGDRQMMLRAISEERNETDEIIEILERRSLHLEETFIPRELRELCDFFYKSKCYFLLMPASRVNRTAAFALCRQQGGDLGDIVDRIHFGKAVALIRSKTLIEHSYNHIWTGMNVDVQARRIRLKNGEWAPYEKWSPNRPFTPARVAVGIHVEYMTTSSITGMFDEHDATKVLGGLCEKNVN